MTRKARWTWLAAGFVCALGAAWLVVRLASAPPGARVARLAAVDGFAPHHDLWVRLLRGALGRVAVPLLLVLAAIALVWLGRRRRWRDGAVASVVLVGANGVVQAIKHGLLVVGPSAPVLSGHMAVVVGSAFAVYLTVRPARRRWAFAAGVAVTLVTGVGVVIAAWHTVPETLAPTLVAVACVLGCRPLVAGGRGARRPALADAVVPRS